jgi:tRNA (cmo5U34)-methyltransferase
MEIGEVFDGLTDNYTGKMNRWVPHYQKLLETTIESVPPNARIKRILDLGCGSGNVSVLAANRFPDSEIFLIDASREMLDIAISRLQDKVTFQFRHAMIQDLYLEESNFDLVTACFSLHHLSGPEKKDVFKKIRSWLKTGGFFSYSDLFIEKNNSATHSKMIKNWEKFVLNNSSGKEDWDFLSDHYSRFDWPNSCETQQKWMKNAGFIAFKWQKFEKVWSHCLAV